MGSPIFKWYPRDSPSNLKTWDFSSVTYNAVSALQGGRASDRVTSFTRSGVAVSVVHDNWDEYSIEIEGIRWNRSAAWSRFFEQMNSWWEHAGAGGQFQFGVDSAKVSSTLLNGALAHNATVLVLDSTTGMSASDWLVAEDANDHSKWVRRQVNTVDSGTNVTLYAEIGRTLSDNSPVRHAEYFPALVCLDTTAPFIERPGGRGPYTFDFKARVRTAR